MMGLRLKYREKDGKWRLWTTISDGWMTEWLGEDEMKESLALYREQDFRLKVIELCWTFPHGFYDKDSNKQLVNRGALIAFSEWHLEALKSDDYDEALTAKYIEVTKGWRLGQ